MSGSRLVQRLKQHRVVQWGLAYLAGAWLLLQVVSLLGDSFAWSPGYIRAVIILLGVGFLGSLIVAWYHGERGRQRVSGLEVSLFAALLVLAGAAVSLVMAGEEVSRAGPPAEGEAGALASGETGAGRDLGARAERVLERGSVGVVPFSNLGPGPEDEYLADGMTEELIGYLGKLEGLRVAARTSSFAFKGTDVPTAEIARQLGVEHLLEGTVRVSGDAFRVSVQLVESASGFQLWSETYDRELADVFAVQREIASAVGRELDLRLPRRLEVFRLSRSPPDLEAYALYLRGRHAWRGRTIEGLELALDFFRRATRRDPSFAEAHAGLADVYVALAGYRHRPLEELVPPAREAVTRALVLDPRLAEAHATRGTLLARVDHSRDSALSAYRHALALNPSYATAYHWYAVTLTELGRLDEASEAFRRAIELDPLAPSLHGAYASALRVRGDLPQAEEVARKASELAPEFFGPLVVLGKVHEAQGRRAEALEAGRQAVALAPGNRVARSALARILARRGEREEARLILAGLEADRYPCAACIAEVYVALEEFDGAFRWLNRDLWHNLGAFFYPKVDPLYAPLRPDPRFMRFLEDAGLQ